MSVCRDAASSSPRRCRCSRSRSSRRRCRRTSGRREAALAEARAAYDRDRTNVGRGGGARRGRRWRSAASGIARDGDRAQEAKPDDPRLLLERGRGLIVIRKFEMAGKELRKAAETLPEASLRARHGAVPRGATTAGARGVRQVPRPGIFAYLADWRTGPSAMPRRPAVDRRRTRRRSGCRRGASRDDAPADGGQLSGRRPNG